MQLLEASSRFAGDLAAGLRDRVDRSVVPQLAQGLVAARGLRKPTAQDLADTDEMALAILFRLLFVAYAEDKDLLPYRWNGLYQRRSLETEPPWRLGSGMRMAATTGYLSCAAVDEPIDLRFVGATENRLREVWERVLATNMDQASALIDVCPHRDDRAHRRRALSCAQAAASHLGGRGPPDHVDGHRTRGSRSEQPGTWRGSFLAATFSSVTLGHRISARGARSDSTCSRNGDVDARCCKHRPALRCPVR